MTQPEAKPDFMPPLGAVTAAYAEILAHNKEYSGLGAIYKALRPGLLMELDADEALPEERRRHAESRVEEGDIHAELQNILHDDVFTPIGLTMEPIGEGQWSRNGFEGRVTNRALKPGVSNTELYKDFLSGLSPEDMADEASSMLATDVIFELDSILFKCLPKDIQLNPNDQAVATSVAEAALRTFLELEGEYERLGLNMPAAYQARIEAGAPEYLGHDYTMYTRAERYQRVYGHLQESVEYWGRGVLPEYINLGNHLNTTDEDGYFGWWDGMQDKLEADIDAIAKLQEDPRTRDFGTELANASMLRIDQAMGVMNRDPEGWFAQNPENTAYLDRLRLKLMQALEQK